MKLTAKNVMLVGGILRLVPRAASVMTYVLIVMEPILMNVLNVKALSSMMILILAWRFVQIENLVTLRTICAKAALKDAQPVHTQNFVQHAMIDIN